jgi:hypothetical protein
MPPQRTVTVTEPGTTAEVSPAGPETAPAEPATTGATTVVVP